MARWHEIETEAPELAAACRLSFDRFVHKTLATIRRDGSPRISGTEVVFADGDLWLGSMWQARKARDLQRDPRFALHSGSVNPPDWSDDAKLSGTLEEVYDPNLIAKINGPVADQPSHLFRADIHELVLTKIGDPADHLVIESWHQGRGLSRLERR